MSLTIFSVLFSVCVSPTSQQHASLMTTPELVEPPTAAAEEEAAAGGRTAERKGQPRTEENISSRRRWSAHPLRLLAVMGLSALGCLLTCWGHHSMRLVPAAAPQAVVSVDKPTPLFYPPPAHHTLLAESAATSPLLSSSHHSPHPLSMIPAIRNDRMSPRDGAGAKKEGERRLGFGEDSEKRPIYVFGISVTDELKAEMERNGLLYIAGVIGDKPNIIETESWHNPLVVVVTDQDREVGTVMRTATKAFLVVFDFVTFPLQKGNRLSEASGMRTPFDQVEPSACVLLTGEDYAPLALRIELRENGFVVAPTYQECWNGLAEEAFPEKVKTERINLLQSFTAVTLSQGGPYAELQVLDAAPEGLRTFISEFNHNQDAAEKDRVKKDFPPLTNIIESIAMSWKKRDDKPLSDIVGNKLHFYAKEGDDLTPSSGGSSEGKYFMGAGYSEVDRNVVVNFKEADKSTHPYIAVLNVRHIYMPIIVIPCNGCWWCLH
eukprot:GHVS01049833.1.p1 GENE.GHVS01049833.1~~GHVS01049833.1.p1  ORF type:complete len:492 (+),score=67.32 GHVS01049833.1:77-1552(+)